MILKNAKIFLLFVLFILCTNGASAEKIFSDQSYSFFKGLLGEYVAEEFFQSSGKASFLPRSGTQGIDLIVVTKHKGAGRPSKPIVLEVKTEDSQLGFVNNGQDQQMSKDWIANRADNIENPVTKKYIKNEVYRRRVVRIKFESDHLKVAYYEVEDAVTDGKPNRKKVNLKKSWENEYKKLPAKYFDSDGNLIVPIPPSGDDPPLVRKWGESYIKSLKKALNGKNEQFKNALIRTGVDAKKAAKIIENLKQNINKGDVSSMKAVLKTISSLTSSEYGVDYIKLINRGISITVANKEIEYIKKLSQQDSQRAARYRANLEYKMYWNDAVSTGVSMALFKNIGTFYQVYQGEEQFSAALGALAIDASGYSLSVKAVNAVIIKTGERFACMAWLPSIAKTYGVETAIAMFAFDSAKFSYTYLKGNMGYDEFIDAVQVQTAQTAKSSISYAIGYSLSNSTLMPVLVVIGMTPGGLPILIGVSVVSIGISWVVEKGIDKLIYVYNQNQPHGDLTIDDIEALCQIKLSDRLTPWNAPISQSPWNPPTHHTPWNPPEHQTPWTANRHRTPWD